MCNLPLSSPSTPPPPSGLYHMDDQIYSGDFENLSIKEGRIVSKCMHLAFIIQFQTIEKSKSYLSESQKISMVELILGKCHFFTRRGGGGLDFINRGIDAVNLPSILRSKSVTETVQTYFKEKEPPIISYTYTKTIASKIFNFSSTLLDLDYHEFHSNRSQCECNTSSHLYKPYGHVITGDLSIIPNSKLRDLIAKRPKIQRAMQVDWDKNLSLLCEAVDQYALQWAKREIVELSVLSSWKEMAKLKNVFPS